MTQLEAAPQVATQRHALWTTLSPLVLDLGLPVATYYLARDGFGVGMVTAFVASSLVSFARLVVGTVRERRVNAMSALVLAVNLASIALSFGTGDVRLVAGKDAVVSSVVGLGVLFTVWRGRPALAEALRPFVTRGQADRDAAWSRLRATSAPFERLVARHSAAFGIAFVLDCAVRVGCAALAPVFVLGWIGTAATVGALIVGAVVGGAVTVEPLEQLIAAELGDRRPVSA